MSELGEVLQAISNLDKKVDVHIAKQTEICEAAKCMRHTHDMVLFGDGSNPDIGLVGGHQRVKSQVEEQGRSISRLEISVDRLVMGIWGVVLLVVIAAATLVWTRATDMQIAGPVGPRGYIGATGNQGNPGADLNSRQ